MFPGKWTALIGITAGFVAMLSGCNRPDSQSRPSVDSATAPIPTPTREIALHEGSCDLPTNRLLSGRADALTDSAADWRTWNIPEYQDAQRFAENQNPPEYGPLACIVAAPNLANLTAAEYAAGALVAIIYLDSIATTRPYTELHLSRAGFYCVVLKGTPPSTLEAYVVPSVNKQCGELTVAKSLKVRAHRSGSATNADDYPPVARFVLKKSWKPGLGLRCGDRWCSIAVAASQIDAASHAVPPAGPGHVRHAVLGWFDQQILAIQDPARPGKLKPSLKASIVADDGLDAYTLTSFGSRTPVAKVYFTDNPKGTKYDTVWKFVQGPNTMDLQRSGTTWTVFINGQPNSLLRVTRTDHASFGTHTHGTARWRWKDKDEAVWVRCAEGCCQVEDPG